MLANVRVRGWERPEKSQKAHENPKAAGRQHWPGDRCWEENQVSWFLLSISPRDFLNNCGCLLIFLFKLGSTNCQHRSIQDFLLNLIS